MTRSENLIAGVVIGGLIGALIGILYAPKSGKETREDIGKKADELLKKAKIEYEDTVRKSKKAYSEAMKHLKKIEKNTLAEAGEKVEELTELGKEAIKAGQESYEEGYCNDVEAFEEEQGKTA